MSDPLIALMKFLKALLAVILALAVLVTIVGFFLPRDFEVTREVEIAAPPAEVFPFINTLSKRKAWSPFQTPETENTFEGPASGAGATMIFEGGKIIITSSKTNERVVYETHFDNGYPTSTSDISFSETTPGKTLVSWKFTGKVRADPFRRYYILRIDSDTGAKHQKGLDKLKQVIESDAQG